MRPLLMALLALALAAPLSAAEGNVLSVSGTTLRLNGEPIKLRGVRLSNAIRSDAEVDEVIANLPVFRSYGVNAFSAFMMGSRFGDIEGIRPDGSLEPVYAARMKRLIDASDQQGMVMVVGALYWSTSTANSELGNWGQADANRAVANVAAFVQGTGRRNIIIDPDNEGMTPWDVGAMIAAAKAVAPLPLYGYNATGTPSANCDLTIHFGARLATKPYVETEGVPENAPGGYWGSYSKQDGLYNYINIGVYSAAMKSDQIARTDSTIRDRAGYFLASTWLQCIPPNHNPGGIGTAADPGIRWWLDHVKATYGAWPAAGGTAPAVDRLVLYNAATAQRIGDLTAATVIDLAATPHVTVVAEANAATGSVRFGLDGVVNVRTENTAPYALFGDNNGIYTAWASPSVGTHTLTATPAAADNFAGILGSARSVTFTVVDGGAAPGDAIRINFQPSPAQAPAVDGWLVDQGLVYGARNGLTYGWSRDISAGARDRNVLSDQLTDTFVHLQTSTPHATWEIAVANGTYQVRLVAGDASFIDSVFRLTLEGQTALSGTPTSGSRFVESISTVTVGDGRLSLGNGAGAINNKLCLIEIVPVPISVN